MTALLVNVLAIHGREVMLIFCLAIGGGLWTLLVMMGTRIATALQWRATITHHMPAIYRAELAARDGRIEELERDLRTLQSEYRERCETLCAVRAVVTGSGRDAPAVRREEPEIRLVSKGRGR